VPYSPTGKNADPEFRHRRAKCGRAAQETTEHYIRKLVDRAPELTPEQRDRLAILLRSA
jgi:hypothetical protein